MNTEVTAMTELDQKRIFSKNLNRLLDNTDKKQVDIAAAIGVSPQTFNTWVKGIAIPRMGKIQALADYFGVPKSDLVDESHDDYYLDPETAKIAQEIKDSKELSALFDVQRNLPPEDLQAVYQMVLALKRKEADRGN